MRSITKTFVLLAAALVLSGCVPSLHPFFTEENIIFDHALLGTWVSESGDKCSFTKSGENHYEFSYTDQTTNRFEARLIKLGGVKYLDLYPKAPENNNGLLMPTHTLARVTIDEDSLSIAMMNDDWLSKLSDRSDLNLAHERAAGGGTIVLTAPTRELQAFILRHAGGEKVFCEAEVYRRASP